ncbi:MAG: hypothetical protein CMJ31_05520 [Phycisphaerae bacterium]|nr:hypothetical protein [Phycisphaerae bacterium]
MAHDYRCRRCRYDLSVLDVKVCPECGVDKPYEPLSGPLARGTRRWERAGMVIVAGPLTFLATSSLVLLVAASLARL